MRKTKYQKKLHQFSQELRWNLTQTEQILWRHLKNRQILEVQFYRQAIVTHYIVDFFAPQINFIIEVDGSQHFEDAYQYYDRTRDNYLMAKGYEILRLNNRQIWFELPYVLQAIYQIVEKKSKVFR